MCTNTCTGHATLPNARAVASVLHCTALAGPCAQLFVTPPAVEVPEVEDPGPLAEPLVDAESPPGHPAPEHAFAEAEALWPPIDVWLALACSRLTVGREGLGGKEVVTATACMPYHRVGKLMNAFIHALHTECSSTTDPVAPPGRSGTSEHRHSHRKGSPSTVFLRRRTQGCGACERA